MFQKQRTYKHRRMVDVACYVLEIVSTNDVATTLNVSWVNTTVCRPHGVVGIICVRTEEFPLWSQIEYDGYTL